MKLLSVVRKSFLRKRRPEELFKDKSDSTHSIIERDFLKFFKTYDFGFFKLTAFNWEGVKEFGVPSVLYVLKSALFPVKTIHLLPSVMVAQPFRCYLLLTVLI